MADPVNSVLERSIEPRRLEFADIDAPRLTHYLFRFPAKFHPPVIHALIRSHTTVGQTILDPFCGSGTLLLAAAAEGRHSVGCDVDPVAAFVSEAKTHRLRPGHLRASWDSLRPALETARRSKTEYEKRCFNDISKKQYEKELSKEFLWVPQIPNLLHWFRKYVVVDLARILQQIESCEIPETHRNFFRLIFASIIRNASNADPVPVSGLEVTSYMKKIDAAGRVIDPFELFRRSTEKGLFAMEEYWAASSKESRISVHNVDVRSMSNRLTTSVDAVITSPPYHNAVDYYRRHKLEMFWLAFTKNQVQRLQLLPRYIGRYGVRKGDPMLQRVAELGQIAKAWHSQMNDVSTARADAFAHYVLSMKDSINHLSVNLKTGCPVVFVVGHSSWNGERIPTSELFVEMARDQLELTDRLWYPVKNRYMSYGRRNGADIDQEHVLVFTKK